MFVLCMSFVCHGLVVPLEMERLRLSTYRYLTYHEVTDYLG